MATNLASERLTQAYRSQNNTIRAAIIRDITRIWPLFSTEDTSGSWPGVLAALKAIVTGHRNTSAQSATQYMTAFRFAEGIQGQFRPVRVPRLPTGQLDTSLTVTGLVQYRKARLVGLTPERAADQALVTVSGAASRLALDGGRETIIGSVRSDRRALGWMRVTRPGCCAFCAMLASRGPVYKNAKSAGFGPDGQPERWHDHCNCSIEPVYSRDTDLPGPSTLAAKLWAQTSQNARGREAVREFRRAWDAQYKTSRPGGGE